MTDGYMTEREQREFTGKLLEAQLEVNRQQVAMVFALAIHLGISCESLMEKTEKIVEQIDNNQNPWTGDEV